VLARSFRIESQLRSDEWMDHNLPLIQMLAQQLVCQNAGGRSRRTYRPEFNAAPPRRRGIFFNPGIVPPKDATAALSAR